MIIIVQPLYRLQKLNITHKILNKKLFILRKYTLIILIINCNLYFMTHVFDIVSCLVTFLHNIFAHIGHLPMIF